MNLAQNCAVLAAVKLQSFRYEGDRKNFNFDKYVHLHVEQHNHLADLQEYGVTPFAKSLKTLWF
jgi:hypothetical protein